ncbi:DUF559 domain-containing protein [Geodermatophilus sp. SYSU D00710]
MAEADGPAVRTRIMGRDRRADAVLTGLGWRVLRFWEHEDPDDVADAIWVALGRTADLVAGPRPPC